MQSVLSIKGFDTTGDEQAPVHCITVIHTPFPQSISWVHSTAIFRTPFVCTKWMNFDLDANTALICEVVINTLHEYPWLQICSIFE